MSITAGTNVGPYRILQKLGQGGMATVYKAYHPALDRHVAIKVLHPAFKADPHFLARFRREARVVAKLEHPNIVPVYDFAEHEGQPYLVMKFVEGETLKARLRRSPLSVDDGNHVIVAVGEALQYAHARGVLHRDVKPSNILISEEGKIYLTDFGLARIAATGASTLSGDMLMGTPQYISPEQARGESDLDQRTDIYSFGIVLYEIVVGRVPFSADTPFSIIHDHIYTPLPLPSEVNPNVPQQVQRVLLRALAKEREDRFKSADQMVQSYQHAIQEEPGGEAIPTWLSETKTSDRIVEVAEEKPTSPASEAKAASTSRPAEGEARREEKKRGRFSWVWIAAGLLIACLSSLGMLAAAGKADLGSLLRELQTTPVDDIRDDLEGLNPELEQAQALVEADPGNPEAHLQLASAYEAAGMMPESTREYARAGEIFLNEDRIFESAKAISEAFRIQGVPLRADENLINLATRVLFLAAPLENSLDIFHLVSQHVPRWDRLKILEARRLIFAGELERADAILGEALEQNPGDVYAQTISAEWNQAKGLNERAGRIVERLLEESDLLPDWLREHLLHFQASVAP